MRKIVGENLERWRKIIGLVVGPLVFLHIIMLDIPSLSPQAHSLLAIMALTVIWWVTEAIPLAMTALLIPFFCIIFNVCDEKTAFSNFANPIIFLFIGSFILARAMEIHSIDKMIALKILSIRWVTGSVIRFTFVFGLIIFSLSAWMSNTATTAMMFPIALSIIKRLQELTGTSMKKFAFGFMLITAYASSLGGLCTPVGSPPNLIGLAMIRQMAHINIGFFQWIIYVAPLAFIFYCYVYIYLYFVSFRSAAKHWNPEIFAKMDRTIPPVKRPQINVILAFGTTVILWVLPGISMIVYGAQSGVYIWLSKHVTEASAALIGVALLFLLPVNFKEFKFTIEWKDAIDINWEAIFLFGGGLTLGTLIFQTQLSDTIARSLLGAIHQPTVLVFIIIFSMFSNMTTELTSNTASANMLVPFAITLCQGSSLSPFYPALATTVGVSLAFMFPVGTPPNAIVYGSGYIPFTKMARNGFLLLLGTGIIESIYFGLMSFFKP